VVLRLDVLVDVDVDVDVGVWVAELNLWSSFDYLDSFSWTCLREEYIPELIFL
jgi:hypothetical protein